MKLLSDTCWKRCCLHISIALSVYVDSYWLICCASVCIDIIWNAVETNVLIAERLNNRGFAGEGVTVLHNSVGAHEYARNRTQQQLTEVICLLLGLEDSAVITFCYNY